MAAQLDPLGSPPPGAPILELDHHKLTEADLRQLPARLVGGPGADDAPHALAAIQALRNVYSATSGHEYAHAHDHSERDWLQQAVESRRFRPTSNDFDAKALLARLTEVEDFEQFLQRVFLGKTRFSVEGLDMLIPILDEIIEHVAQLESSSDSTLESTPNALDVPLILIGMAH